MAGLHFHPDMCGPSIILAEDEPIIALEIRLRLESEGYAVIAASDPGDLLHKCQQHHPAIAIINFKQKTWVESGSLIPILQSQKQLRVLCVTGARASDLHLPPGFGPVLFKPFSRAQLSQHLHALSADFLP